MNAILLFVIVCSCVFRMLFVATVLIRCFAQQPYLEGQLGLRDVTITNNIFITVMGCSEQSHCIPLVDPDVTGFVQKDNRVFP